MILGFKLIIGITHQQAAKVFEVAGCKPKKFKFSLPVNNPIRGIMVNYVRGNPLLWLTINASVLVSGKETGDILLCREPDFNGLDQRFKAALSDVIGTETADSLPPLKYWGIDTLVFGMDIKAANIPALLSVIAKTDLPAGNIYPQEKTVEPTSVKGPIKPDIENFYNTRSGDTLLKIAVKSDLIMAGRIDYKGIKEDILPGIEATLRLTMIHNYGALEYVRKFLEKHGTGMGYTEACLNPIVVTDAFIQTYVNSIGVGDFYTVAAALQKIERDISSIKNRAVLRGLVTLIGESGSIPAAREAAGDLKAFTESLQLLRDLGINGAPLADEHGIDRIKNPFAEVFDHCNQYASAEASTERRPNFKYKMKKPVQRKRAPLQPVTLRPLEEAAAVEFKQGLLQASAEEQKTIEWLLRHGGPAVRLRMATAGMISADAADVTAAVNALLRIERVTKTLSYLDRFDEYRTIKRPWDTLIHNCYENCYETYMPFLEDIGFHKGILPAFDVKMEKLREVYHYLSQIPQHGPGKLLIHMLKTGFCYSDMEAFVVKRLNEVYPVTQANRFDFYETDPAKIRQPKRWLRDRYQMLKDEFNPYAPPKNGEKWLPLPDSYDALLLLSFYPYTDNREIREKTDAVMRFYLDARYQATGGDYGWHYDYVKNTYHASSGGIPLPLYDSAEPIRPYNFLGMLEWLSLSPVLRQAAWFEKSLDYCEKYKTERQTYLFPGKFIYQPQMSSFYELYIDKELLPALKADEKKSLAFECFGTLMVTLVKMRSRTQENS